MAERRLATLLHISDLHFGDLDPDGDSVLDADAEAWWAANELFDGYLGHSGDALVQLTDSFAQLTSREEVTLVVTGDLTAVGKPSQFELARQYLEAKISLDPANPVGLGVPDALTRTIPGNHDHWPGRRTIFGPPTQTLRRLFPDLPVRIQRKQLAGTPAELVLVLVNSDADVRLGSPSRILARGRFVSQLKDASRRLGPPRRHEIRVLLVHHSPMYKGRLPLQTMAVRPSSRKRLNRFIERCGIAVMLTGHMHNVPAFHIRPVSNGGVSWSVLEARCGTTTQRDEPPPGWPGPTLKYQRRFKPATFLVHRLYELDDGTIEWRTTKYGRTLRGFRDQGSLCPAVAVWP
ncbi:MAG: metallophosphoesterase family protein [Thermoanaerobaculia bacterium]